MRAEFEKSPKTSELLEDGIYYDEIDGRYKTNDMSLALIILFLNGRWEVWQEQQTRVDDLQKQNVWFGEVAERENKRANKLQEEHVCTTVLLGKTVQLKEEMQMRLDAALQVFEKGRNGCFDIYDLFGELEQTLKGES